MATRRTLTLWCSLAVLAASCGGSDDPAASSTAAPPTAESPATEPTVPATEPTTEPTAPATAPTAPPTSQTAPVDSAPPETTIAPEVPAIDRVTPPEASTVDALLALDRPIVIAHAGGDFEAPHSTMYAFTEAALAGADVLELDVMLTADEVLVVHHDDTVDRTTQATGRTRTFTYDELAALDNAFWWVAGTWSDQSLPDDAYTLRGVRTGERPPPAGYGADDFRIETFRSIATAFPDHVLDVEIKVQSTADGAPDLVQSARTAAVLAEEIVALDRTDSVVVVSFDAGTIAAFRELAPDVATSPALETLVSWYVGEPVEFAPTDLVFQVPPVYEGVEVLTPDVIARAHADGFEVWVWMDDTSTQEQADFYRDLLARGADGLLVSRPSVARDVVAG
jgi:glycerophosphoryl diester phosphodiesterase